jgi:predicted transposase YbfD/YdcC
MLTIGDREAVSLVHFFDDLPDPRSRVNRLHRLGDVIVIAICAVVATADGPTAIAQWAELNEAWLKTHLALPHGIPGKDTFRRVLSMLSPALFQQCFSAWIDGLTGSGEENVEAGEQRYIAIDGKTLRRSHDRKNGLGPLHVVSAGASDRGVTLGQVATDEKSNEITAIPELLTILDLEDAVVTIDAAGCQKTIAAQIVKGRGDYVLALKGNHDKRFNDVRLALAGPLQDAVATRSVSRYVAVEQGHGRLESRTYYQIAAPDWLHGRSDWKGLKTIGVVVRVCEENGVETSDTRFYLSSLRRHGERFAQAVRSPWGIENSLHWSLDMTYREDESRVRNRKFAENLAWLPGSALTLG